MEMLKDVVGAVWRRMPRKLRRWSIRFTQSRFTVTAAGIVRDESGRVLLLRHRFRGGSAWGIPGGFIERGEQPEAALRRELHEEASLEIADVKLFTTRAFRSAKQIEIVFLCRAKGKTGELSYEIKEASWFLPGELPGQLPPDQARLIKLAAADGADI